MHAYCIIILSYSNTYNVLFEISVR